MLLNQPYFETLMFTELGQFAKSRSEILMSTNASLRELFWTLNQVIKM